MSSQEIRRIGIIGPTAVGKTRISLGLAEKLKAEIISVDSRQVYRYLDIGTDKVSVETRHHILHHAIDVADPDELFSAADFVSIADAAEKRIASRGRIPLLVGGTPFYYQAFLGGLLAPGLPRDWELRRKLAAESMGKGRSSLYERLRQVDPESAARIHPNDFVRIERALEIYELTGEPASKRRLEGLQETKNKKSILFIGLVRQREALRKNIEARVREQFRKGFPEEVKWLLDQGFSPDLPSLQGFGYRELVAFHRGALSLEEALEADIRSTWAFMRRQMTWFRKFSPCVWYDLSVMDETVAINRIFMECRAFLQLEAYGL